MPPFSDSPHPPIRTRDWFRMAVACATNFAVASAPCHGFADATLPVIPVSEDLLLAALLPEREGAVLDAGGSPAPEVSPFAWPPPSAPRPWHPPQLPPAARPETLAAEWSAPVETGPASPAAEPPAAPWQPGEIPAGGDPAPPPGVFGQLPIEQQAGNCVVTGEVSDSTTLDPIPGAIVDIIGTGRTAETDAQGRFRIDGLPEGNFTAEASALNYTPATLGVSPVASGPVQLRFSLRQKPADTGSEEYVLEEESIVGEYTESTEGDFNLTLATEAPNISSGLDKSELSRTGASDAAGAVSKISGANVVGGKYAVVRGLGDRYSNTLFNGSLIPSADPSKKAVQLDLFPSDLIESVSITKLFTPDLPAEFAGGTVRIATLRYPNEPVISVSVGAKWFENSPDGPFMGDPNVKTGFDNMKLPRLPGGFDKPNQFNGSVEHQMLLHQSAPMRASAVDDEIGEQLSVVLGNTFQLTEGVKLGAVFALTRETENEYEDLQLGRNYTPNNPITSAQNDPALIRTQRTEVFGRDLTFGTMAGLSLNASDKHEISYTRFAYDSYQDVYNRTTNLDDLQLSSPLYVVNPYGIRDESGELVRAAAVNKFGIDSFEPLQRELEVNQFSGSHVIYGEKGRGGTVGWAVSDSTATEERPQTRTLYHSTLDFTDRDRLQPILEFIPDAWHPEFGHYDTAGDADTGHAPPVVESFRESLKTEDHGQNARIDFSLPWYFTETGDDHVGLKFGYNWNKREREVRGRFFTYDFRLINDSLLPEDSSGEYQGDFGNDFLNGINSGFYPGTNIPIFGGNGITIIDNSSSGRTVRNVDAGTELDALYISADLSLGNWLIEGGFRHETENRSYQVLPGLNPDFIANAQPVTFTESAFLPGIVMTGRFGKDEQITVTGAWSRTIARPTFYEFAPVEIQDQTTGDKTRGNSSLTDSSISNFDLRFDWTPEPDTNVGLGFFHKSIENPIVAVFDPVFGANSWINGDNGTLQGVELESNRLFLDRIRVGGNFTYIDSELSYKLLGNQLNTGFEGQPNYILNLFLGYENKDKGLNANLVYNITGEYMSLVPLDASIPAVFEDSFASLDLIMSKDISLWNCDGKVKLVVRNILDSTRRQYYEGTDFTYRESSPGRSVTLSFDASF